MATHTVSNNRKVIWEIDENGDTWILEKKASIGVVGFTAIYEANQFSGNSIRILGDITALGGATGVRIDGDETSLLIGNTATVKGGAAVRAGGLDQHITIEGNALGTVYGIWSHGNNAVVTNNGSVFSNIGVRLQGEDALFINGKKGTLDGETSILTESNTLVNIRNKGVINGNSAIMIEDGTTEDGAAHVINTGKIFGLVYLGSGDDIFDTRKGTLISTVSGGNGDDVYLISKANTNLDESGGEGNDTVKSTVSYALWSDFENLTLLGKKNIDGEGNDQANFLTGNSGRNTLEAHEGVDILNGGKGNDTLNGANDNVLDLYAFDRGTGDDVVTIFEDGDDLISLINYDGLDAFGDIVVAQDGTDTLITLLDGDTVRLKNFWSANFTSADVVFDAF